MPANIASATSSLRIAVVTETYPPEINGVALTVARIVRGLRANGHRVQVVRPRQQADSTMPDATDREGDVLTFGIPIPRYPELKAGLPCGTRLRRLWLKDRPDLVHVATEGPLGWSAVMAARALGIPCVSEFRTNFHAYSEHYGIGCLRGLVLRYLRTFHNRCHATMTPTSALANELKAEGFQRLHVVGRGVDTSLFNPGRRSEELRRQWGAGPKDLVVLSVGRLAPEKNLTLLQRSAEAITKQHPGARMVIVGDGPCRQNLQQRMPFAIFTGKQREEALATHYASGDVLLFPSLTETFGNVTLEAMASGLGVVAFNYGSAAGAIQHGRSGWLAERADEGAFVAAALHAAAHPAERARARAAAASNAAQMSWDHVLSDLMLVYSQSMQAHGGPKSIRASQDTAIWAEGMAPNNAGTSAQQGAQ
jgi:glycosyltransferase involved in cell wall biosynthesis